MPPLFPALGPIDYLRAPIIPAGVTSEAFLTPDDLDAWARGHLARCGHVRDLSPDCRACRDVEAVISALSTGAPVVRVVPSR